MTVVSVLYVLNLWICSLFANNGYVLNVKGMK
jgi:hypothetical protein